MWLGVRKLIQKGLNSDSLYLFNIPHPRLLQAVGAAQGRGERGGEVVQGPVLYYFHLPECILQGFFSRMVTVDEGGGGVAPKSSERQIAYA